MARFIVIECGTDRIYGDTAQLGAKGNVDSPVDAVHLLDQKFGRAARGFGYVGPQSPSASYRVYEVPQTQQIGATTSDAEAQEFVIEHGSFVTALVTYNS